MRSLHFANRTEAGRLLADKLTAYAGRGDTVILALPRGGVPVGFEMARRLGLPLDIIGVRKLGVPGQEELAFGAIASGGVRILDSEIIEAVGLTRETVERVASVEHAELDRRELAFRSGGTRVPVRDRTVILVDDGIATGSTMLSAIAAARRLGASRVVVAAGVAPDATVRTLAGEADEVACLLTPRDFRAVSLFYADFPQLTDDDVRALLGQAASSRHAE